MCQVDGHPEVSLLAHVRNILAGLVITAHVGRLRGEPFLAIMCRFAVRPILEGIVVSSVFPDWEVLFVSDLALVIEHVFELLSSPDWLFSCFPHLRKFL